MESRTQVFVVFIDDLPSVSISPLRATRAVLPTDEFAWVQVGGEDFKLRLHQRELMHGVRFTYFLCPRGCGRKARKLWLLGAGQLACCRCCNAAGIRYRIEHMTPSRRAEYRAPRLRAMLSSLTPLTSKVGKNRMWMQRRRSLERALVLCELRLRRTRAEGQFR